MTEQYNPRVRLFAKAVDVDFLRKPVNRMPSDQKSFVAEMERWFESTSFFEIYDFVEFSVKRSAGVLFNGDTDAFVGRLNAAMERERSGYRIVGGHVVPITSAIEMKAIQDALTPNIFGSSASIHLNEALRLLSSGDADTYRNVVKEAISSIEALVVELTGDDRATLGQALKLIGMENEIHPALSGAFQKLYGYTSDASGIRHAIFDKTTIDLSEARFMLIACSAFVNFVTDRAKSRR